MSFPSIFALALKYAFLIMITSIPILQFLWRLIKKFNRHGELYIANSIIEIVASMIVIMTLLMAVLADVVETGQRVRIGADMNTVVTKLSFSR